MKEPPSTWRALLLRVLPERDRDELVEVLDGMYADRVTQAGVRQANRWYRREVMAFAARVPQGVWGRIGMMMGGVGMDWIRDWARAARGLARSPGFSALAAFTLALGIGANALVFALADRALFRPLPYPDDHELVSVLDGWGASPASIDLLQEESTAFASLGGAWDAAGMTLEQTDAVPQRVTVAQVYPSYLATLGVSPVAGRLLDPESREPGAMPTVMLGNGFWMERFGGSGDAIGATLTLEGERYEIVGVLPAGFDMPSARNDLWVASRIDPADVGTYWGAGLYTVVGRLAEGVTPEQARAEVAALGEPVRLANPLWTPPSGFWSDARVTPLRNARGQYARTPLLVLLVAVGLVLAVVCANVTNLLLARGLARGHEEAVRSALGAGRWRLAMGRMWESLTLAAAGLVLGLILAQVGLAALRPHLPAELPGAGQVALDLRVGLATGAAGLLASILAGVLPAFRSGGRLPGMALQERGRGGARVGRRHGTMRALVAGQMAVAVLLVSSAGLMTRTLFALNDVDPGFVPDRLVTARVDLPAGLSGDGEARATYFRELRATLAASGDVTGVALASSLPFGAESESMAAFIPGVTDDPNNLPVVRHHRVSPEFFQVMEIPLLEGRVFDESDRVGSVLTVVVDRAFQERFFPGEDPVGRTVRYPWRGAPDMQVVGVVGATANGDLAWDREPTVWAPLEQMSLGAPGTVMIVASGSGGPQAALTAVQQGVRSHDPGIALSEEMPYPDLLATSMDSTRLLSLLLAIFAGVTLLLGAVGVYGVVILTVRERTREIGVRLTLGADPAAIRARVLRQGMSMVVPGAVAGLLIMVAAGRVVESLLFGVSRLDPISLVASAAVLLSAGLLAVYLPARRATGVDPARVLREG